MQYRAPFRNTDIALCVLLVTACDEQAESTNDKPLPVQAAATLAGNIDLRAVVDVVASGEVENAAALEKRLAADAIARVDLDEDGKRDELRIVERRIDGRSVFEIRAVPSSKVEIDAALAPSIATLTLEPKPESGHAIARARYTSSFADVVGLDADATVEHTFTGLGFEADGRLHVEASANVFVGWAFRVGRPVYVAELFIVETDVPAHDPCWPPGHCKHGHWKARDGEKHRSDAALVRIVVDTDHGKRKHEHKKHKKHKKHR